LLVFFWIPQTHVNRGVVAMAESSYCVVQLCNTLLDCKRGAKRGVF
jgi:hypothetical protein